MTFRHSLALTMTAFLTLSSLAARPAVLGVVVAADRVHLNTTAVTAGATVYEGDQFSTEAKGLLRVRIGTAMLELAEASVVSVRNRANSTQGMEVELANGTLVSSTTRTASLKYEMIGARIQINSMEEKK
jgi:hypothetical protein